MKLSPHLKRLSRMVVPYKGRLLLALLGMVITAATEPTLAAMMKLLLDNGFGGKVSFSLWLVPAFVIGIFALRGFSTFMTNYMLAWVTTRMLN